MTNQNCFDLVRARTNTNTNTLTNTNLFLFLNERNRQLVAALQAIRENYKSEVSTANLVADQQEYVLPDDAMRLKRLEVTYDGTNWKNVIFFDINERRKQTDTTTVSNDFSTDKPYADVHDTSVFLYPVPTAARTNGLKLWYSVRPQDMTLTTQSADVPKEYHMFLVELITLDAEVSRGRLAPTVAMEKTEEIVRIFQRTAAPRNDGARTIIRSTLENYR